jgi:spore coat assembly protein
MDINKGDYVTRNSYNNDTIFKVVNIKDGIYYLKGIEVRLYADSDVYDLKKCEEPVIVDDYKDERSKKDTDDDFFYMPPRILHIDSDSEYLERCLKYYKHYGIYSIGKRIDEDDISNQLEMLLKEYKPDIVIITGHDSLKKDSNKYDLNNYKNTKNFIKAIKCARKYESSHEKLVIIAGACQSNYEELIKSGANFASSPKRVNIHALDPAIIAVNIALTERNKEIDLKEILDKTKYGKDGMGGLICNGLMYVGYPR